MSKGNGKGPQHRNYTEGLHAVAERSGIPISSVRKVVEGLMDVAEESLLSDRGHFNLGRFGTLEMKDIAAGKVRNPRAKPGDADEYFMAPARKKVRFRPSSALETSIKEHFNIGASEKVTAEPETANA